MIYLNIHRKKNIAVVRSIFVGQTLWANPITNRYCSRASYFYSHAIDVAVKCFFSSLSRFISKHEKRGV